MESNFHRLHWIVCSPPFSHTSAGIRVLHRLSSMLVTQGDCSRVVGHVQVGGHCFAKHDVVVYPEVVRGNPLGAKRVVRYVLNAPGLLGGDTHYAPSELVIYHSPALEKCAKQASGDGQAHLVAISAINPACFYPAQVIATMSAFPSGKAEWGEKIAIYVGKGDRAKAPWPENALEITREWPASGSATEALLRSCTDVFCYDTFTAVLDEATLCGARVWVPKDGQWTLWMTSPSFPLIGQDWNADAFRKRHEYMWEEQSTEAVKRLQTLVNDRWWA